MILKTAELALLLGLTSRRVNQLAEEGITVRAGHGEFDGPASVQNYVASIANRAKDGEAAIDKEREEARLKKEQADHFEFKNAKLRKELLPIDEVSRVWSEQIAEVRSGMLAVVSRVSQRLSLSCSLISFSIHSESLSFCGGLKVAITLFKVACVGVIDLSSIRELRHRLADFLVDLDCILWRGDGVARGAGAL